MMRSKFSVLLATVLITSLLVVGCGNSQPASSQQGQQAPAKTVNLSVAFPSAAGLSDIGSLVTFENMKKDGYNVTSNFMSKNELAVQAVVGKQADFGVCASATVVTAIQAGSPIVIFGQRTRNLWVLGAKTDIKTVQDLNGKRYAIHSTNSLTAAVTNWLIKKNNIKPNIMIVPGSDVRMQALLNNQIDASPLDLTTWEMLNKQAPGKFHILVNWMDQLPGLDDLVYFASKDWIQSHPDIVNDILKTELTTYRAAKKDPETFYSKIKTYFPDDKESEDRAALEPLLKAGVYDVNGGGSNFADESYSFYLDSGWLTGDTSKLKVTDFFDSSYLTKILDQLGRQ